MPKPFVLDNETPDPPPAVNKARFGREERSGNAAGYVNPLAEDEPGANVQKVADAWAPGIGQNSAEIAQQKKPWPAITKPKSAFKE